MSNLGREKVTYPEKDSNNLNLNVDKNIHIYDNDDAYMLNFEKENNNEENDPRENISDLDNFDKLKAREKELKDSTNNICDEIDNQINVRKEYESHNTNSNNDKFLKNYNSNYSNLRKKGKNKKNFILLM